VARKGPLAFLITLLCVPIWVFAREKPQKTYPLHGTIIKMATERAYASPGVYTDNSGRVHGGQLGSHLVPSYTIQTAERTYLATSRRRRDATLKVGDQVDFRTEGRWLFVRTDDGKEAKFILAAETMQGAPPTQSAPQR
jgi:hypothetical protein